MQSDFPILTQLITFCSIFLIIQYVSTIIVPVPVPPSPYSCITNFHVRKYPSLNFSKYIVICFRVQQVGTGTQQKNGRIFNNLPLQAKPPFGKTLRNFTCFHSSSATEINPYAKSPLPACMAAHIHDGRLWFR